LYIHSKYPSKIRTFSQRAEGRVLHIQSQPGQHNKTLSQKQNKIINKKGFFFFYNFTSFSFLFKYLIHFELIYVYIVKLGSNFLLHETIQKSQHHVWKVSFVTLVQNQLRTHWFLDPHLILLIYMLIVVVKPHRLDYHCFVVHFKTWVLLYSFS
jgi:hypothetical protein